MLWSDPYEEYADQGDPEPGAEVLLGLRHQMIDYVYRKMNAEATA